LVAYLAVHGKPIEYGYLHGRFPLADHQTVYAGEPVVPRCPAPVLRSPIACWSG